MDISREAVERLAAHISKTCGCAIGPNAEQPVAATLRAQAERIKELESAAMDRLVAEGQRCDAMTPQECECAGGSRHVPKGSDLEHCDLCGLPLPGQAMTPQEAAKVLWDMLQLSDGIPKIDQDAVQALWDRVQEAGGFYPVQEFLAELAGIDTGEDNG